MFVICIRRKVIHTNTYKLIFINAIALTGLYVYMGKALT